jgi:hypothetical protein
MWLWYSTYHRLGAQVRVEAITIQHALKKEEVGLPQRVQVHQWLLPPFPYQLCTCLSSM